MTDFSAFDGHNDTLLRLWKNHAAAPETAFIAGTPDGQLDLPKARAGGLAGGLFAVFPPSTEKFDFSLYATPLGVDVPLPYPLTLEAGRESTLAMIALLFRLERAGALAICRSRAEINTAIAAGKLAAVLHIEGAEAIDANLDMLEVLYAAGLRSIGPVWSRPNIFAHGVPIRFPSDANIGPGLTDAGKALVQACNRLNMLIDLSHLNEQGFWDVAKLSTAPLVATHSNAHAVCASSRNLTDKQLAAIADSNGFVGVNFATGFLRPDGRWLPDTPLSVMLQHFDHLIDKLGEDRVGLGSDFDGAMVPAEIGTAAGLPKLAEAMLAHGYGEALVRKLFIGNWLDVLGRVIG